MKKTIAVLFPIIASTIIFAGSGYLIYQYVFYQEDVASKIVEEVGKDVSEPVINDFGPMDVEATPGRPQRSRQSDEEQGKMHEVKSKQGYAPIKIKIADDGRIVIPIVTSYPHRGSDVIVGTQMSIAVRNYLKELRHTIKDDAGKEYNFYFELKGNNDATDAQGLRFIKDLVARSPILMGYLETELLERLEPMIKEKKVLILFPGDGDSSFREKGYKNVVHFRPTYEQELKALVHYLIKESDKRKCAIFYEASVWGESVYKKLCNVLKGRNIEVVATGSYPQGSVEVGNALRSITHSTPNVVFCLAKPRPTYSFVKNAVSRGLHNCLFFGMSDLNIIQRLLSQTKVSDQVVITSLVPHPKDQSMRVAKEYSEIMKNFLSFRTSSPFFVESFLTCQLLTAALQHLKPDQITIENIIDQLKEIMKKPFKDFPLLASERPIWINPGVNKTWERVVIHNGRVLWHEEKK